MSELNDPKPGVPTAFDRWAARLFAVLLTLIVIVVFVALVAGGDLPPGARLLAIGGAPIGAIVLLLVMLGLHDGKPWARPTAVALLIILVVAGVVQFVAELGTTLWIPLEAIAAALVLRLPRNIPSTTETTTRDRRLVPILAGLYLLATAWPLVTSAALRAGASPFAVGPEALDLRVAVDCTDAAAAREVRATVTWTWQASDVLPGSTDGLLVAWAPSGDAEGPYYDQEASTWPDSVWPGGGSPAMTLIQPLEQSMGYGRSTTFGIDVARSGQLDGTVHLVLHASDSTRHGTVEVGAIYAHLDRWTTSAVAQSCGW
jgi:hypothetical protein